MPKVTTGQAAKILRMTIPGVHALVKKGHLKAEKFGRDLMLDLADVERVKGSRPRPGRPAKTGVVSGRKK